MCPRPHLLRVGRADRDVPRASFAVVQFVNDEHRHDEMNILRASRHDSGPLDLIEVALMVEIDVGVRYDEYASSATPAFDLGGEILTCLLDHPRPLVKFEIYHRCQRSQAAR